jgi:hypothetical protein
MANTTDNVKVEHTVTFQIPAGNIFDVRTKKAVLDKFARQEMEVQEKLEKILSDPETINILAKFSELPIKDQERVQAIITSDKALKGLETNWTLLKNMFT